MSFAKATVAEFVSELMRRAKYGIRGEKPLAIIAALKYLDEKQLIGQRLLELFPPHTHKVRSYFIDLADRYSRLDDPSNSWSVVVSGEIQNSIRGFGNVDEAFRRLTAEEIRSLLERYIRNLRRIKGVSQAGKAKTKPNASLRYPLAEAHEPPISPEDRDPKVAALLEFGKRIRPRELFPVLHEDAAVLIENSPFAFALAAVLDRGTKSEIIWTIPYYLKERLGNLNPSSLKKIPVEKLEKIFRSLPAKPRYITDAPHTVKELSAIVMREYQGDVSKIWENKTSNHVKATFQRIYGVGPGIASMIVLLLERCFGVRFTDVDHKNMDVKPDVHIIRVFQRLGFIFRPDETEALKAARRLNPEYPGALDPPTWLIGKKYCIPWSPKCHACPLSMVCPKNID